MSATSIRSRRTRGSRRSATTVARSGTPRRGGADRGVRAFDGVDRQGGRGERRWPRRSTPRPQHREPLPPPWTSGRACRRSGRSVNRASLERELREDPRLRGGARTITDSERRAAGPRPPRRTATRRPRPDHRRHHACHRSGSGHRRQAALLRTSQRKYCNGALVRVVVGGHGVGSGRFGLDVVVPDASSTSVRRGRYGPVG